MCSTHRKIIITHSVSTYSIMKLVFRLRSTSVCRADNQRRSKSKIIHTVYTVVGLRRRRRKILFAWQNNNNYD